MDTWFCEDCVLRLKRNSALKDEQVVEERDDPEHDEMSDIQIDLDQQSDEQTNSMMVLRDSLVGQAIANQQKVYDGGV